MMPPVLTDELASVLRTVAQADLCERSTIAKACGRAVPDQLNELHAAGLVMRQAARRHDRTRTTLYTISTTGREQLSAFDASFRGRLAVVNGAATVASPRTAHLTTTGYYAGAELSPYDGRPGAMDAFSLPSRMGSRLHYRSGLIAHVESAPREETAA